MLTEARREQLRAAGRKGGRVRAAQPGFIEHQRRAGKRSAEVNDMAALGHLGAQAFIRKYGYIKFFQLNRNYRLARPSSLERTMMAILDGLKVEYQREALVMGEHIPLAVDFYLPDCNDSVIEVLGRVHFDQRFDHPNRVETRRGLDLHRIRKLERAGFRVLEIDYTELVNPARVALKVAGFLVG